MKRKDAEEKRRLAIDRHIRNHLDDAIANDWIYVVYQPIARTVSMKICAAEALVRWRDPEYGEISPAQFIPILEDEHRMFELDLYVFECVLRAQQLIRDSGMQMVPISVNLSRSDFLDTDLLPLIEKIVAEYRIPKEYIRFEVAEYVLREERGERSITDMVEHISEKGYGIWMDNFGGGYSSIGALMDSHFDLLKYDMRFLRGRDLRGGDKRLKAAISYVVNMSKDLAMGTLAQGVESEAEYRYLRDAGCAMVQGYFVSKPLLLSDYMRQEMELEDDADRRYYTALGKVKIEDNGGLYTEKSARHIEPMAVMEYKRHRFHYIYSNDVHEMYMESLGLRTRNEVERFLNQPAGFLQDKIRRFVGHLMRGDQQTKLNFVLRGQLVELRADFIARNERNGAVLLCLYSTVVMDWAHDRSADFEFLMQEGAYRLFDKIDLVRVSDGIIINSYLNTADYGAMHEGMPADQSLRQFAKYCIEETERSRFLTFFDLDTLDARLREVDGEYLSDIFETLMEDGRRVRKQYVMMPAERDGNAMIFIGILNCPV